MTPSRWPRSQPLNNRLLVIDGATQSWTDARVADLGRFLNPGDLVIVNDAATLPAAFFARTETRELIEIRLICHQHGTRFLAVLLGAGNWRTRTEDRLSPPILKAGARLQIEGSSLQAQILETSVVSPRSVTLEFNLDESATWREMYRAGHPIQYSHLNGNLDLWDVQTAYASRPWAMEMPSAGKPLQWKLLLDLMRHGVNLAALTHAAGVSASGDPVLDALLPLPERYDLPLATIEAIDSTHNQGGRVIAIGTSVTRALEGNYARHGKLVAGLGMTDLILQPGFERQIVDGILSGMHEATETHFRLLSCFLDESLLQAAVEHAEASGYLSHEFGDSCLILPETQII
ncbi:MAG TPA: S-adenosylmethionine:tRNA ribosyltransferase-isomerase [Acidobacteriota bacterium]|nr:S-adenosylmethionine:tRNA ribosyltransferase-isomerase [Acidobacteriota bacterium]